MEKPKIFISHITEEKDLARMLKEEISKAFLGLPEIFVSSDDESISIGSRWLDRIDDSLRDSQIILILCSQNSVKRPWINFEAGAGWIKGIPVVPICHTDMDPVQLPIPLNMLQAIKGNAKKDLEKVMDLVAKQLGAKITPQLDYDKVIQSILDFEKDYGTIQVAKHHVNQIIKIEPGISPIFQPDKKSDNAAGFLSDINIDKIKPHLEVLKNMGLLDYAIGGNTRISPAGLDMEFKVVIHPNYYEIAEKIMVS
ncbi:toll/interleukin-1 receptor domain-containing protein [Bacillus cereus]|nr:toll/interleukin-1 receptor domain-containing protein [Bacillus cereus]